MRRRQPEYTFEHRNVGECRRLLIEGDLHTYSRHCCIAGGQQRHQVLIN